MRPGFPVIGRRLRVGVAVQRRRLLLLLLMWLLLLLLMWLLLLLWLLLWLLLLRLLVVCCCSERALTCGVWSESGLERLLLHIACTTTVVHDSRQILLLVSL